MVTSVKDLEDYATLLEIAATLTPRDIWKAMPLSRRQSGLSGFLRNSPGDNLRQHLQHSLLRESRGFRPQVIRNWGDSELTRHAARLTRPDEDIIRRTMLGIFLYESQDIQVTFFDAAGIPHNDGHIIGEISSPAATDERTESATLQLLSKRPDEALVHLYLLALAVLFGEQWPAIAGILERTSAAADKAIAESSLEVAESLDGNAADPVDQASTPEVRQRLDRRMRWTALDELLIREIVRTGASSDLETAPAPPASETVARAIRELIAADPMRYRSYHHLGLLHGLLNQPVATSIPSENDRRRRWYHAGWITGRAREHDNVAILTLFDSDTRVRELGNGGEATEYAAILVVDALASADRHSEASRFISAAAIPACGDSFARSLLTRATGLLRDDRAAEARGYLQVLESGLALREVSGLESDPLLVSDTQRRLAHCLRHERAFEESRARLESLLESDLAPRYRAMVLADIGLMDAGLHRLSAIRLPDSSGAATDLRCALERGLERFAEAAALDAIERAHGEYPLGVIAMLQGEYERASELLERASIQFQSERDRYQSGGLIENAQYFAAIAGILADARSLRARELTERIILGLRNGQPFPALYVEDLLIGVIDTDESLVRPLVEAFLERNTEVALEVILQLELKSARPAVVEALLARIERTRRKSADEVRLMRTAFLALRDEGDDERAGQLLEQMQDLALEGIGVEETLSLLRDPSALTGLWDVDERDATLLTSLERLGRYAEAGQVVHDTVHRLLSGDRFDRLEQAEDLLSQLRGYGEAGAPFTAPLQDRLAALTGEFSSLAAPPRASAYRPTICIVGGDETQIQYQARLRKWASQPDIDIDLKFIYSGWTSNWNSYLDEFKRMRAGLDGVVVLQFVRTEFGRSIRKHCDGRPQIGTWGHGEKSMQRAVLTVADMVRQKHASSFA